MIDGVRPVALAIQDAERDERVGEVGDRAGVQTQRLLDLRTRHVMRAQMREQLELHRREERAGGEKAHSDVHDVSGIKRGFFHR